MVYGTDKRRSGTYEHIMFNFNLQYKFLQNIAPPSVATDFGSDSLEQFTDHELTPRH